MKVTINCDGGSRGNPGPSAWGFIVKNSKGKTLHEDKSFIGKNTNNFAEYSGILAAIIWVNNHHKLHKISKAEIILDSELATKQLNGLYKVKSKTLLPLVIKIKEIVHQTPKVLFIFSHVLREENVEADALVNIALDENIS